MIYIGGNMNYIDNSQRKLGRIKINRLNKK